MILQPLGDTEDTEQLTRLQLSSLMSKCTANIFTYVLKVRSFKYKTGEQILQITDYESQFTFWCSTTTVWA